MHHNFCGLKDNFFNVTIEVPVSHPKGYHKFDKVLKFLILVPKKMIKIVLKNLRIPLKLLDLFPFPSPHI